MTTRSSISAHERPVLLGCVNRLADAALVSAGDGLLLESDTKPLIEYQYVEPHFALQLYLLNRAGLRDAGIAESARRLRLWGDRRIRPIFFSSMAISMLGIAAREDNVFDPELASAISRLQRRRRDFTKTAWQWTCGNNMYVQQLVTDQLLAPLAEGRALSADTADKLRDAFHACLGDDGYFFDLPRPGGVAARQFPLTYNLKFLFLLILCVHYLPDPQLKRMLATSLEATLALFTEQGDCSFFGRTDRTTFAAGLAVFCVRAAAAKNIGGSYVRDLVLRAEQRFSTFPIGVDGCLEVNGYPLPASDKDLILSRDDYAFRWQYAVAGAAYCLLGRRLFPLQERTEGTASTNGPPELFASGDLGIIRSRVGDQDLYVRTGSAQAPEDRRHAGPTLLRLEYRGQTIIGTIPRTMSSDAVVTLGWQGRSRLARHIDLLRYRWKYGFENFQAELAGYVPVLRQGHNAWVPMGSKQERMAAGRIVSVHRFRKVRASGWPPTWNHLAGLARIHVPAVIRRVLPDQPLLAEEVDIELTREITQLDDSIVIEDSIAGDIVGKTLFVGTRFLVPCETDVENIQVGNRLFGWSSDGRQDIQLYSSKCVGNRCDYRLKIRLP